MSQTPLEGLLQTPLEELPNPLGADAVIRLMINYGTPVTLQNYLALAFGPEEPGPEQVVQIPRMLFDPRLKGLDPNETYYSLILHAVSNNPELTVAEARQMMGEFA